MEANSRVSGRKLEKLGAASRTARELKFQRLVDSRETSPLRLRIRHAVCRNLRLGRITPSEFVHDTSHPRWKSAANFLLPDGTTLVTMQPILASLAVILRSPYEHRRDNQKLPAAKRNVSRRHRKAYRPPALLSVAG